MVYVYTTNPVAPPSAQWPHHQPSGPTINPVDPPSAQWPNHQPSDPTIGLVAQPSAQWPHHQPSGPTSSGPTISPVAPPSTQWPKLRFGGPTIQCSRYAHPGGAVATEDKTIMCLIHTWLVMLSTSIIAAVEPVSSDCVAILPSCV